VSKLHEEKEQAIIKGSTYHTLNTRITHEAQVSLMMAWAILQSQYNKTKFPKQSAVSEIIIIGSRVICEQIESNKKESIKSYEINNKQLRKQELYEKINQK
jgi:hypothetical protein